MQPTLNFFVHCDFHYRALMATMRQKLAIVKLFVFLPNPTSSHDEMTQVLDDTQINYPHLSYQRLKGL
jgi:hypothetical protein